MTICSETTDRGLRPGLRGCVLVELGGGASGEGAATSGPAAERLTRVLGARLLALGIEDGPDRGLSDLLERAEAEPAPWLAALPLDVGAPLAGGGCWAEALGAWRQPTLLVIPAEQLAGGVPAAGWALLRQWRVPLLGLLQCGGVWNAGERRSDGLPWLGQLPQAGGRGTVVDPDGDEASRAVAAAFRLRLNSLQQG